MAKKNEFVSRRDYGRSLTNKDNILPPTVSIVGLGCSSFSTFFWTDAQVEKDGGKFTAETIQREHPIVQDWIATIHHAILHCGVTLLDTAPWYGHGTSEIVVGWALREVLGKTAADGAATTIHREDLCINTKIGRYEADPKLQFDFSRATTILSAKRSLERLSGGGDDGGGDGNILGYIDVLQLHDPEFSPTLELLMEETVPALIECREKGWCKALGMTGYPLEVQYQIFQATLDKYGSKNATAIWDQALTYCHFNLHDQSLVSRKITTKGSSSATSTAAYNSFAHYCQQYNVGLLAAAPLSMGLLTHNAIAEWHPATGSKLERACEQAGKICKDHRVDIVTLALVFAMSHPRIPCTILGMKDVEQVDAAAALARRFQGIDWNARGLSQDDVLHQVFTQSELEVYRILSDKESGPFAELHKDQNESDGTPLYQWNGAEEAHEFWKAIDGAHVEDWQLKSLHSQFCVAQMTKMSSLRRPSVLKEPKESKAENNNENDAEIDIEELVDIESPLQLAPKAPSKSPVFCCFFAEFDIKKGPIICHQAPKGFMDQDINTITMHRIHEILARTFRELARQQQAETTFSDAKATEDGRHRHRKEELLRQEGETADFEGEQQVVGCDEKVGAEGPGENNAETGATPQVNEDFPSSTSTNEDLGQSIFEATSEYIITGELSGKIITLSTHDMHIMTRPTQIADERYERNALLFSIGFVLRRAADPRPFRPLISKLAMTLRSMEVESEVLSSPTKAQRIQPLLEKILISMNSPRWECNFLLDQSTALNLKLFHPPKPQASPVHQHQVPILLRRDVQLQIEWDLAINWVILHVDGVTSARQISIKAEVDLEMVLACLRVLKHHGVIHVVDMFMYTNRYEFTDKAAAMLAGNDDKLLQEAVTFAMKRPTIHLPSAQTLAAAGANQSIRSGGSETGHTTGSPRMGSPFLPGGTLVAPGTPSSSYPPRTLNLLAAGGSHRSTNLRFAMLAANSLERDAACLGRHQEERRYLKAALAELYCACNRNISFGDLWLFLSAEKPIVGPNTSRHNMYRSTKMPINNQHRMSRRGFPISEMDICDSNIVMGHSSLEASLLESMRRNRSDTRTTNQQKGNTRSDSQKTRNAPPNWNTIFKDFDHRRFITFGVVHGLLIRVHSYPLYSGSSFPDKRSSSLEPSVALAKGERSHRHPINFQQELKQERNFQLAKSIAAAMDGSRCDDEIVCRFEQPLKILVDLVEKFSGRRVIFIYSTDRSGI